MIQHTDPLAQVKLRQEELYDRLTHCPLVEVTGLVPPDGGPGGGGWSGDKPWTLRFELEPWRDDKGNLRQERLQLIKSVSEEELHQFMKIINAYDVIRIHARIAESPASPGKFDALMESFLGIETDDKELNAIAEDLKNPVIMRDPKLGKLVLDRRLNWFCGKIKWQRKPVILHITTSKTEEVQDALKTAHSLLDNHSDWHKRIRDFAVKELLPLKNQNWLDEDEAELTAADFTNKMKLESITILPGGFFEFWHDDGGLFLGHSIQICGNLTDGPTSADIPG